MRRTLVVGLAIAACNLAANTASAQQTLTSIVASPSSGVPVGVATPVLVTVVINGEGVIPESVVLQRIDAAGRVLATLGKASITARMGTSRRATGCLLHGRRCMNWRPARFGCECRRHSLERSRACCRRQSQSR